MCVSYRHYIQEYWPPCREYYFWMQGVKGGASGLYSVSVKVKDIVCVRSWSKVWYMEGEGGHMV